MELTRDNAGSVAINVVWAIRRIPEGFAFEGVALNEDNSAALVAFHVSGPLPWITVHHAMPVVYFQDRHSGFVIVTDYRRPIFPMQAAIQVVTFFDNNAGPVVTANVRRSFLRIAMEPLILPVPFQHHGARYRIELSDDSLVHDPTHISS